MEYKKISPEENEKFINLVRKYLTTVGKASPSEFLQILAKKYELGFIPAWVGLGKEELSYYPNNLLSLKLILSSVVKRMQGLAHGKVFSIEQVNWEDYVPFMDALSEDLLFTLGDPVKKPQLAKGISFYTKINRERKKEYEKLNFLKLCHEYHKKNFPKEIFPGKKTLISHNNYPDQKKKAITLLKLRSEIGQKQIISLSKKLKSLESSYIKCKKSFNGKKMANYSFEKYESCKKINQFIATQNVILQNYCLPRMFPRKYNWD